MIPFSPGLAAEYAATIAADRRRDHHARVPEPPTPESGVRRRRLRAPRLGVRRLALS
jgi:hypothetical protein